MTWAQTLRTKRWAQFGALPVLLYGVSFGIYSYPWVTKIGSSIFGSGSDPLQNIWNLWWFKYALLHGINPYATTMLHAPEGTSLLGHTLSPLNGLLGLPLQLIMGPTTSYNVLVAGAFISTGVTALWLCYYITRSYWASLIGGFIFTFSSYHFAHGFGHLNLVSLEWLPLFTLAWLKMLDTRSWKWAAGAGVLLALNGYTDMYYLLFSVFIAATISIGYTVGRKLPVSWASVRTHLIAVAIFLLVGGALPILVLAAGHHDPFSGAHQARQYSMDATMPFIPSSITQLGQLIPRAQHDQQVGLVEAGTSLSLGVLALLLGLVIQLLRRRVKRPFQAYLWFGVLGVFSILALGPRLIVLSHHLQSIPLPYSLAARIVPGFSLAGMPIRMAVVMQLAAAILAAIALSQLNLQRRSHQLTAVGVVTLIVLTSWPIRLPTTERAYPNFTPALASLPEGSVIDLSDTDGAALYAQTLHQKPQAFGYISRTPESVVARDAQIRTAITSTDYRVLCQTYGFTYIISSSPSLPLAKAWSSGTNTVYTLRPQGHCADILVPS